MPESFQLADAAGAALHLVFDQVQRRARILRDFDGSSAVSGDRAELVQALQGLILCAVGTLPLNRAHHAWLHLSTRSHDGRVVVSIRVECNADQPALEPYDLPPTVGEVAVRHGGVLRAVRENERALRFDLELPGAP